MKLSEINTDKALDVLCEIIPYVHNIISDEELVAEIKKKVSDAENLTSADYISLGIEKINNIIPIVFRKKRKDLYGILGALNNKNTEEIRKQNFLVTARQIKELINDKDLIDFFKSCTSMVGGE